MTLEQIALANLNIPYCWNGKNALTGLDCSGLVEHVLMMFGIDPPGVMNSKGMYEFYLNKSFSSEAKKGALLFYGRSVNEITHIAIMINDNQIFEAGGGDSTTTNLEAAKSRGAMTRIRPFGHRKDLVAIVMPNYPSWARI